MRKKSVRRGLPSGLPTSSLLAEIQKEMIRTNAAFFYACRTGKAIQRAFDDNQIPGRSNDLAETRYLQKDNVKKRSQVCHGLDVLATKHVRFLVGASVGHRGLAEESDRA
jgi:hypothetical protein